MNNSRACVASLLSLVMAACGPVDMNPDGAAPDGSATVDTGVGTDGGARIDVVNPPIDSGTMSMPDATMMSMPDAAPQGRIDISTPAPGDPATRSRADVCGVWNASVARARTAGMFAAGAGMCAAGTLPQNTVDAAVLMTNTYRYLAGLVNVAENPEHTRAAQACAELMEANRMLSHNPPMSWTCFTALGATGAARSNITSGGSSPVASLAGWVDDSRDISNTLGHRRWILFPPLGAIGYGQARSYACQYVLGARGSARKAWVAWPNEGVTPMESMSRIWSFSSASAGVTAMTTATVTLNGTPVPAMPMLRANGYGDPTISWNMPAITAGGMYHVTIRGLTGGMTVEYDVNPVQCGG
jgi:uncharacterized protein YkwD